MRCRIVAAIAFSLVLLVCTASSALAANQLPVIYNGIYGYSHASPTASPPGANDWSCRPSAAHPDPVILVHGTFGDMSDSWQALSPLLYDNGYCVFALNYGSYNGSGSVGHLRHRPDRELRPAALAVRRPRAGRHRCAQGRPGGALAGRDDAALLHQEPGRRLEGEHAGRAGPLEPRHHAERHLHAGRATSRARTRSSPTVRPVRSRRRAHRSSPSSTPAARRTRP